MPEPTPAHPAVNSHPGKARPVLVWHPGRDEQHVKADAAEAARHLDVTVEALVTAIDGGDLIQGWFVDWAAPSQLRPRRA